MSVRQWDTREPAPPEFEAAWRTRLAACPHANFMLDPGYLKDEADHGRHAVAALIDADGRRAAMVLRRERRGMVSGRPWRWQMVIEGAPADQPIGLDAADAPWLLEHADSGFVEEGAGRLRGFEIDIDHLTGKRFLSQQRTEADRRSLIEHLSKEGSGAAHDVARLVVP